MQPGTYQVRCTAPANSMGVHRVRLIFTTDTSQNDVGSSASDNNLDITTVSTLDTMVTIGAFDTMTFQSRGNQTGFFGRATNFDSEDEIYTQVIVKRII